jgi:hypothetical protein
LPQIVLRFFASALPTAWCCLTSVLWSYLRGSSVEFWWSFGHLVALPFVELWLEAMMERKEDEDGTE